MAPVIASPRAEGSPLRLHWSARLSLTSRILALNLFLIVITAGGLFYLDSYRTRLVEERRLRAEAEVVMVARGWGRLPMAERPAYLADMASATRSRLRVYRADGAKIADSFALAPPTYRIQGTVGESLDKTAARFLDRLFDFLVGTRGIRRFAEPATDRAEAWPEIRAASQGGRAAMIRYAPDFTHVVSAAHVAENGGGIRFLLTANPREVRAFIRDERLGLAILGILTILLSAFLSWFLARTIVKPLRQLVRAAVRVRLGRSREINVPRLPSRRDEIGTLARAISDMSQALRDRIDATESFAADVAHELKNPLASLRSALDTLGSVRDPDLADQLLGVARDDVRRMDRLITDISDASRLDSQLSRIRFDRIDLGAMVGELVAGRATRPGAEERRLAFRPPSAGSTLILGDDMRIERAIDNIIDNALSFAPPNSQVEIGVAPLGAGLVRLWVADRGPGVPPGEREAIFRRFHSSRPPGQFGRHSGLGLAIARSVVEAHQGSIRVIDRPDGGTGALFEIILPRADADEDEMVE